MTATAASRPEAPPGAGAGVKVVVLGGGIAGLISAYEMRKAGFQCTVLEARELPGGRVWTIRNGASFDLVDGYKKDRSVRLRQLLLRQLLQSWPRIPSIHRNILGYAKELGVELESKSTARAARSW